MQIFIVNLHQKITLATLHVPRHNLSLISGGKLLQIILRTLEEKSHHTKASVWSKTSLNTGCIGGTWVDPPTCKMTIFFLMSLRRIHPCSAHTACIQAIFTPNRGFRTKTFSSSVYKVTCRSTYSITQQKNLKKQFI